MRPALFLLLLSAAILSWAPAASAGGSSALDRPDLLVYSSFAPRSSGALSDGNGGTFQAAVVFFGNLSAVRNVAQATTGGSTTQLLLGYSLAGYAGGFAPSGDAARLYFTLDEPDSFSRTGKKIAIQQKAWLTLSATGLVGMDAFSSNAVQVEDCSAKAALKDKTGNRVTDQASLKLKCKNIEALLAQLGLTGAPAQAVRDVFGTKKVSISAKDSDGPAVGAD